MRYGAIGISVAALLCIFSVNSLAQATGQISGTAKDQSGAVLPGVEVNAIQTETGITRSTVSNETGFFVLPNLLVGPYRLEASLPGFRSFEHSNPHAVPALTNAIFKATGMRIRQLPVRTAGLA